MTGSTPFSIEKSDNFQRSFKKLIKFHGNGFVEIVAQVLEDLIEDQYPNNSRQEPFCRTSQSSKATGSVGSS